ncbi:MAG: ParB/RepB/Spo0J family partition protein [Syntrophobacteraceae bacterium]|jgi:ParB family chromosome partitioning protein
MAEPPQSPTFSKGQIYSIDIGSLRPDPNQPRKHFDRGALEELTNSIRRQGVLQPVIFRLSKEGELLLVAGHRRLMAARNAGLEKIPAIFAEGNPTEIALVENLLRENLTVIEEAEALDALMKEHRYTQEQLAETLGKGRSTISEILSLTKLPQRIRNECRVDPKCPKRVLIEIAKKKQQRAMETLYEKFKTRGLTSDEVRKLSRKKGRESVRITFDQIESLRKRLASLDLVSLAPTDREKLRTGLDILRQKLDEKLSILNS